MRKSLGELAILVGGEVVGDPSTEISGASDIVDAREGDIVFAETPKLLAEAQNSRASAVIALPDAANSRKPLLKTANPRYAFARVLEVFSPKVELPVGIHPTSAIGSRFAAGERLSVGFNAYIGNDVTVGDNVWIHPFACIGNRVRLGNGCIIHPFVAVRDGVSIGNNVVIHSGSVIGSDGFGYTRIGDKHHKIPQIGTVVIGDDVEIGANVTIDRARTGKTEIGSGTKIDNLVQIAHNVSIGENCIIIAQVGISGSVSVGDRVILAGQSGAKDHLTIGSDSIVCARAGVIGDVTPGSFVSGYPARAHKEQMRAHAAFQKLPELSRLVRELAKRVKALEESTE